MKNGKWIKDQESYYCSLCGTCIDPLVDLEIEDYKYCPHCGSKMEVVSGDN